MERVYVVFNGEIYKFDNDVNLAGYLELCCDNKEVTDRENGVYYGDEL